MKTNRAMKLVLTPVSDGLLTMLLSGRVNEEAIQPRSSLLWVSSLWARPKPLRVVFSADAKGKWAWSAPWTEALARETVGDYEVDFALRGARGSR
jgi:hypothetical protein